MVSGAGGNRSPGPRQGLDLVAHHDAVLAAGHVGAAEHLAVARELAGRGTVIVTHAMEELAGPNLSVGQCAELAALGIDYVAPGDAAATGLPDAAIDAVTNSLVLEHVPPAAIRAIFAEWHRIVRTGGIVSSTIDPSEHYRHGDSRVSPWKFHTYDERP